MLRSPCTSRRNKPLVCRPLHTMPFQSMRTRGMRNHHDYPNLHSTIRAAPLQKDPNSQDVPARRYPPRADQLKGIGFMLIETTQAFDTKEDAEDNLEGIKGLPGFLYGYIRIPSALGQK